MRLLYLCADQKIQLRGVNGSAVHLRHVAAALQRRGHKVTVACARLGSDNGLPDVEAVVELRRGDCAEVAGLVARTGADAVIERFCLESGPGRVASAAAGIPLLLEVNAPILLEARRSCELLELAQPLTTETRQWDAADHVTVVSRALGAYVHRASPAVPVSWVPNGVDVADFAGALPDDLGLPRDALVVGFVGNPKPWHGLGDLIEAFAEVAKTRPNAHLVIVGANREGESLRARAPDMAGRIHLLGTLPHKRVPGVVARFDVAVAPYRPVANFYFCPITLFEYLAAGRPVVHPGLGDIPELVGLAGVFYPPGDVARLARALGRLLDDPRRRTAISACARRLGVSWSWDRAAATLERRITALGCPRAGPNVRVPGAGSRRRGRSG